MVGDLPPSSSMQGTKLSAAALATSFPFSELPVKIIKSKGCLVIVLATSMPPWIHEYRSWSRYLVKSFSKTLEVCADNSEGLRMTALPAAIDVATCGSEVLYVILYIYNKYKQKTKDSSKHLWPKLLQAVQGWCNSFQDQHLM